MTGNSKPRSPGSRFGLDEMMAGPFDKPEQTLNALEAAKLAYREARRQGKECKAIRVSEKPARKGQLFDALGDSVPFPEGEAYRRCYVALLDPSPRTRWGHSAYWAFVPADGQGTIVIRDTDLPEAAQGPLSLFPVDMTYMEKP